MSAVSSGCYIVDAGYNVVSVNETAKAIYPQLIAGKKCYQCLMNLDHPCGPCPVANKVEGPQTYIDPIRNIRESVDAVRIKLEGYGECHMLVFATVGEQATIAATLPKSAEELTNLALIKALTEEYVDVFTVKLSTGDLRLYRHNGKALMNGTELKKDYVYKEQLNTYINQYVVEEDRAKMREQCSIEYIRERLKDAESFSVHYRVEYNGEIRYYFRKIVRLGDAGDNDLVIIGVMCEDDEVRERIRTQVLERNLQEVECDSRIGLYTREAFMVHGEELLQENSNVEYDFCILKIANISMLNHQYGYMATDEILEIIGRELTKYQKTDNCIGYMGNGEFVSLTVTESAEKRRLALDTFRDAILSACQIPNISMKWSIYVSVDRNLTLSELYDKTGFALSTIRSNTNSDYVEFDQKIIERMEWEEHIEKTFEKALNKGEFKVWLQPKYSTQTGKIEGAEALVRWFTDNGDMIPPIRFIPVLEERGKIDQLDTYVFRKVCELQHQLCEINGINIPISVNLSRASMFTAELADRYASIVKECGIDPGMVPIEITESAAIRATTITHFAEELIAHGFRLHMDDFGAGYSSLASLQRIPFENIKLDKSLIDLIGGGTAEKILKHTIAFAKESGLTVTAEGVENYEQFMFLKVAGCDMIQGYYFSKPIDQEAFIKAFEEQ